MFPNPLSDDIPPDNPHVDKGVHPTSQYFPSVNPLAANREPAATVPGGELVTKAGLPNSEGLGVFTGITSVEATNQFVSELTSKEIEWNNLVSGGVGMGLEILAAVVDPFAYVGGQLLSWMLEHVEPLRAVLDGLAGNPDIIEAYAQSWKNISVEMSSIAADFANNVSSNASAFVGLAGDAYRARAEDTRHLVDAAAIASDSIRQLTLAMGEIVAGIRTAVRDLTTALAGELVANAAIALVVGPGTAAAVANSMKAISFAMVRTGSWLHTYREVLGAAITELMVLRDLFDGVNKGFIAMHES